jgi:hypothetical protein
MLVFHQEPLVEAVISNYPTEYIISNKIRAKYYTRDLQDKIPLKYLNDDCIDFVYFDVIKQGKKVSIEYLTNMLTGERIVKNKNAGEVRTKPINGSDLHECTMLPAIRAMIVNTIADAVNPLIEKLKVTNPTSFPLKAHFIFYSDTTQDLGNHFPFYEKVIMDLFKKNNLIPDDKRKYIDGLYFDIAPTYSKNILIIRLYNNY